MNKFNLDEVYRIALEVRNWAEHLWFQNDGDPDLTGCCVIASTKLMKDLQSAGYEVVMHISEFHGYICIGKYVVDVTATQFNFEDVVVIKPKKFFVEHFNVNIRMAYALNDGNYTVCRSVEDVFTHQRKNMWPLSQSAITYAKEM